jgi:twitching motility protein PilT
VPAVEILVANTRVRERIADPERLAELDDEMVQGDLYGMQNFDQSLVQLYRNSLVAREDAIAHANAASEMRFSLDRADLERTQETPAAPPPPTPPPVPVAPIARAAAV